MAYLKQEYMDYLYAKGYEGPGAYCNALDNIEKFFSVSIDDEYDKDKCDTLRKIIQETRKNPERIGKNEHDVRTYASKLNRYIEFKQNSKKRTNDIVDSVESNTFNYSTIETPINYYIHTFFERWKDIEYKWNAVKVFQKHWNISAEDFTGMFSQATKLSSFISLSRGVPKRSVLLLLQKDMERTKQLFEILYDETVPLRERSEYFYEELNKLATKYNVELHGRTNLVYLFLRFPEKYYIYKSSHMLALRQFLSGNESLQRSGSQTKKMLEEYNLLDQIKQIFTKYTEFCNQYKRFINEKGYSDDNYGVLVSDFCEAFGESNCIEGIEDMDENTSKRIWLYSPGKQAVNWNRDIETGTMAIGWGFLGDLSKYSSKEDILDAFRDRYNNDESHKNDVTAVWQFANEISIGDIVIAKRGISTVIGKGVVTGRYFHNENFDTCKNTIPVDWVEIGEWEHPGAAVVKTLTDITPYEDYVQKLLSLFDNDNLVPVVMDSYTKTDFLNDVYIDEAKYETCVSRLKHKKNLILQGAPGVGKTFAARRLAWSMMGIKDDSRIEFVQFHQSYSYEDFIMGYKPVENGFSLENGIFYDFCIKAKNDSENDYFFIIDEINRGNMSKIFGELLMLIESDYRNNSIKLAYNKQPFSIPENLYIIGMMNTADRSLAMIDYALRRRFSFVEMTPGFDSDGFKKYQADINSTAFDRLIGRIKALNSDIENDPSLGKGFCIGHSYFCNLDNDCDISVLKEIIEYDIVPMLEEYWFDDKATANRHSDDLRGVLNG